MTTGTRFSRSFLETLSTGAGLAWTSCAACGKTNWNRFVLISHCSTMSTQPEAQDRLRFAPGINDFKIAVGEVGNIARGKLRPPRSRDGCNLCIRDDLSVSRASGAQLR